MTAQTAKSRAYSWAVALIAGSGLLLQLIQPDDPTPAIYYFTVWSAFGVMLATPVVAAFQSPLARFILRACSTGSVASALVYLTALAPRNGWGANWLTIAANVALHVVLPLAVILWTLLAADVRPALALDLLTVGFPLTYFLVTTLAQVTSGFRSPYAFLRPGSEVSALTVVGGFTALWVAIILSFRYFGRRGASSPLLDRSPGSGTD